jgi:hypothetical protein
LSVCPLSYLAGALENPAGIFLAFSRAIPTSRAALINRRKLAEHSASGALLFSVSQYRCPGALAEGVKTLVSRPPIVLHHPCVTMLLLVQPDLLQKAFSNERLLVGGLLARCLAADSKMEVQYEDEKNSA